MWPGNAAAASIVAAYVAARAQTVVDGPDGAPAVVQRKPHAMTGAWEIGFITGSPITSPGLSHG